MRKAVTTPHSIIFFSLPPPFKYLRFYLKSTKFLTWSSVVLLNFLGTSKKKSIMQMHSNRTFRACNGIARQILFYSRWREKKSRTASSQEISSASFRTRTANSLKGWGWVDGGATAGWWIQFLLFRHSCFVYKFFFSSHQMKFIFLWVQSVRLDQNCWQLIKTGFSLPPSISNLRMIKEKLRRL